MNEQYFDSLKDLKAYLVHVDYSQIIALTDHCCELLCLPKLIEVNIPIDYTITMQAGEQSKTLEGCQFIWDSLIKFNADRHTIILNVGGGVVTDIGGFGASVYKRGIRFINIPTSILAMVDAAIGSKTGIDYHEYKNFIGTFSEPLALCSDATFLETLPVEEWVNGYAEVYKHGLIGDLSLLHLLHGHQGSIHDLDWTLILAKASKVKKDIVSQDPLEKNLRKTLNFGHTVGHGMESALLKSPNPISHGMAVAMGMICESQIAFQRSKITSSELETIKNHLLEIFSPKPIENIYFESILSYCKSDKKNKGGFIHCALIGPLGTCTYDDAVTEEDIMQSLDYYNRSIAK